MVLKAQRILVCRTCGSECRASGCGSAAFRARRGLRGLELWVCVSVCMCTYIYIYIYVGTDIERDADRGKDRHTASSTF